MLNGSLLWWEAIEPICDVQELFNFMLKYYCQRRGLLNIKLRLKVTIPILVLMKTSQIKSFWRLLLLKIFMVYNSFWKLVRQKIFWNSLKKILNLCFCRIERRKSQQNLHWYNFGKIARRKKGYASAKKFYRVKSG